MKRGFTLVELSIVLVIIGLLVGGILVARSMIYTAKIQRLVRNMQQYEIAITNFKMNYKYYPGDNSYFIPPGNADNWITVGGCNVPYSASEAYQAFAHLVQAKMLSGNYVPWSPSACGGSHTNTANEQGGITAPYIELDSKASQWIVEKKWTLWLSKAPDSNAYLPLILNASDVIPFETKIGLSTYGLGLSNNYGQGVCGGAGGAPFPCTDSNALFGDLVYFIRPN